MRFLAQSPEELLSGAHTDVMSSGRGVVLGSRNQMPNPDLMDLDGAGELEGWNLGASPRPDSFNVYIRQLTSIGLNAVHTPLRDTHLQRQNPSRIGYDEDFFLKSSALDETSP